MSLDNKLKTVKTVLCFLVVIDTLTLFTVVEEFNTSLETPTENQTNVSNKQMHIEGTEGKILSKHTTLECPS